MGDVVDVRLGACDVDYLDGQSTDVGAAQPLRQEVSRIGDLRSEAARPTTLAGGKARRIWVKVSAAWATSG